jgi:molybdenum cofactor cytidylyltransferase
MTAVEPQRIAGIILAAGASTRMGEPKQLLSLAGRPLLQHVLDAAAGAALAEVLVVVGHAGEAIRAAVRVPARARLVVNARWADGQASSLACGLAAAADDATAAAVLLGDQPGVTSGLIDAVVAAFVAGGGPIVRPVWTRADGAAHPGHPVVLARSVWPALAGVTGDHGARAVLAAHPEWVRELAMPGAPLADIDDRADYRRAGGG